MGDLSKNFSRSEFACPCCGKDDISQDLIDNLQLARDAIGLPFKINSGVRCVKHNAEVGGEPNSAHLRGMAADIQCLDSHTRFRMLFDFIRRFKRIEIRETWLHVDIAKDLSQEVVFFK